MRQIDAVHALHLTSQRSILILHYHLRLDLASGLPPLGFPTNPLYAPLLAPIYATCPTHLVLLDLVTRMIICEDNTQSSNWSEKRIAATGYEPNTEVLGVLFNDAVN